MDKIILPRIEASGCHGCYDEEKISPQDFIIRISMATDTLPAAQSSNLADTIDYAAVCVNARRLVAENSFDLIETLAERIAHMVLASTKAESVAGEVEKCAARAGDYAFPAIVAIERSWS